MTEQEMLKLSVEEFSRLQGYMLVTDKDSEAYKIMKVRYIELKVILTSSGIDLSELDRIKEQITEQCLTNKSKALFLSKFLTKIFTKILCKW